MAWLDIGVTEQTKANRWNDGLIFGRKWKKKVGERYQNVGRFAPSYPQVFRLNVLRIRIITCKERADKLVIAQRLGLTCANWCSDCQVYTQGHSATLHPRNFLLALYVLTGVLTCYCQEGSLTSYLLNTTRYSNKFRPVLDDNYTVEVKHSLILHRIVKVVSKAHAHSLALMIARQSQACLRHEYFSLLWKKGNINLYIGKNCKIRKIE